MPGVPRELAEHKLRVDPKARPVKESLRRFSSEKRKAIGQEIARLLAAGFIREIFHSEWLANPVMVPKKDKTWRTCVDFRHINKVCPKDHFHFLALTRLWVSHRGARDYVSLMHTRVIIKSDYMNEMNSKRCL